MIDYAALHVQLIHDSLRDVAGLHLGLLGQGHGHIAGEIAVVFILGHLDDKIGARFIIQFACFFGLRHALRYFAAQSLHYLFDKIHFPSSIFSSIKSSAALSPADK